MDGYGLSDEAATDYRDDVKRERRAAAATAVITREINTAPSPSHMSYS